MILNCIYIFCCSTNTTVILFKRLCIPELQGQSNIPCEKVKTQPVASVTIGTNHRKLHFDNIRTKTLCYYI